MFVCIVGMVFFMPQFSAVPLAKNSKIKRSRRKSVNKQSNLSLGKQSRLKHVMWRGHHRSGKENSHFYYPNLDQDVYHGTRVPDPYRRLEDIENASTKKWIKKQNQKTEAYLSKIAGRDSIHEKLKSISDETAAAVDEDRVGAHLYSLKQVPGENTRAIFRRSILGGKEELLVGEKEFQSDSGRTNIASFEVSPNEKFLLYSLQQNGQDWKQWRIENLQTGQQLSDTISWTNFSYPAWLPDDSGFFYGGFYDHNDPSSPCERCKLMFHKTGTEQSKDEVVFETKKDQLAGVIVSKDGEYITIHVTKDSTGTTEVYLHPLKGQANRKKLTHSFESRTFYVGQEKQDLFFYTDSDAPLGKVVSLDSKQTELVFRTVIEERKHVLRSTLQTGDEFLLHYLRDAASMLEIYSPKDKRSRSIKLPFLGDVSNLSWNAKDPNYAYFNLETFLHPKREYRVDLRTRKVEPLGVDPVYRSFDSSRFKIKQHFITSKDGTRFPAFVVSAKKMKYDGKNPTILYGYGGFNISKTPHFSAMHMTWLEMGGVFVVANIRGGGEYGREWHRAGQKLNKQNVFDDFIAAAEWLITEQISSKEKLAVQGRSNGGMVVATVVNQRPDLFAAAIPNVGVMDMVRFEKFPAGRYWTDDFGSVANEKEFRNILSYSPYHNINDKHYPAILTTTGDSDDRVTPGHSYKYVAALQDKPNGESPALLRVDENSGHGGGKSMEHLTSENADRLTFLVKHLNVELPGDFSQP